MNGANDVTIKLGLDDTALPAPVQRVNAAIASIGKTGEISARQTAAAMRTLPAQFTDIATQLAGGQSPLLILLQQGGQIKDSFGGIGPAISALRTVITPTILAAGGLTVGIAAAAAAAARGKEEFNAYRAAILLTGNEAGVTVGKLDALARSASARGGGTQGNAAGIAAQLAGAGDISRASLGGATEAAITLQRDLGVEVGKTVEAFAALGRDPLKAVVDLNRRQNFLTMATYEQIKALSEQGRTAEAAAVAQDAYARAAISRSGEMRASLGLLERGWRGIKDGAAEAWDAMLGLGREKTVEQELADVQRRLAEPVRRGGNALQAEARREALRQREGELQERLRLEQRFADKQAREAAAVQAKAKADAAAKEQKKPPLVTYDILDANDARILLLEAQQVQDGLVDSFFAAQLAKDDERKGKRLDQESVYLQQILDNNARAGAELIEDERARGEALIALHLEQARRDVALRFPEGGARDEALRLLDEQALVGRRRLEVDLRKSGDKLAEETGKAIYDDTRQAISAAFRDSNNPIRAFGNALANTIYTRTTASLIDALATAAVGGNGRSGFLGNLLDLVGGVQGGGYSVDTTGISTNNPGVSLPTRGGMATGTNYVPKNMLALVHEGEAIVPKQYNPAASGGGTPSVTIINNTGTAAQAAVGRGSDGGLEVVLTALEGRMADRVASGEGAFTQALQGRFGLRPSFG